MNATTSSAAWLRVFGAASLVALATCAEEAPPTSPGGEIASVHANVTQDSPGITQTLLTSGNNTVNQKVYTTAAIAPVPNALILLAVIGHRAYGAAASPIVIGGGMTTWEEVATVTFDPVGSPLKRVTLYRAMSAAPGSGPITITFANSVSNTQWIVSQWTGVDVSGTNGSGAIAQLGSTSGDGANGLALTLAAFEQANNAAYGVFGVRSSAVAVTPGSGFIETAEHPSAETPPSDLQAEWASNDNTIDASWAGLNGAALGVEIRAAIPPDVATVVVSPGDASVGTGAMLQLSATPRDAAGNPLSGRAVTWTTSDASVATVSEAGLVTGLNVGTVTITATSEGQSGHAAVTVGAPVASVDVAPASADVQAGGTVQLSATARDANGDPLPGRAPSWTSNDEAIATVSSDGLVTAIAEGSVTITATSEGRTGSAVLTVTPAPVASVEVSPAITSVPAKSTVQLSATAKEARGFVLSGRAVVWASDNVAVATVDESGLVRGLAMGSVTITATSEGISGSASLTVTRAVVASVDVTPATATLELGETAQFTAVPKDIDGEVLSGRAVTWTSSQPAVASVKTSGLATALSEGSTTIVATSEGTSGTTAIVVSPPPPGSPRTLVGAGDIAVCGQSDDEATALLLDEIPGTVFTAGDNTSSKADPAEFTNCYEPSWGRHKGRTRPAPGNHDYNTSNAAGYFGYFGAAAGEAGKGYYSYDLGEWHIIVLNSIISTSVGSPQEQWLRADLAASTKVCQAAIWHNPLWTTSSSRSTNLKVKPLWDALFAAGAELVIHGHDHSYQRFAPQTPGGVLDAAGIRQFTVGTGGTSHYGFSSAGSNIEVRNNTAYGVLRLTLRSDGYDWKFVPVAGQTFTDEGSGTCHGPWQPPPNQPPVARAGGPYRSEGVVAFDGRASTDPDGNTPLTYTWDFGDGTAATGAMPSHTYATDGVYTVTLVVTDALGLASAPATATATIANIAPVVNAGANVFVRLGDALSLSSSFSDPGENDGPWAYVVDWGDGTSSSGTALTQSSPLAASHVYAAVGTYTVRVTVTDKDGGTGSDDLTATVTESVPAAITPTLLTSGNNTVNQKVYTTSSIAAAPNALILVAVVGHRIYGANPSPIVTGGGMTTWEEVATVTFDPVGSPLKRITLYRAMSPSPGSGPITIAFPNNVSNAQWIVTQWEGVDASGTNGSGAIVQTGSARADAVSGLSVTLAPFESAINAAYGVFGVNSSTAAVAPGSGFAEMAEAASAESPPSALQSEGATNVNTVAALWSSLRAGALAVEIRARP
ncbi:MAG TPA: Ig-like domain-containing protein [Gemmatimonadaceae bacterium]|nr:Ig-like domain-containing protein [Gemmatimonadaceae bacterium]